MHSGNRDFERIYAAMAAHDLRPVPTLVEMTQDDALSWGIGCIRQFPGGAGAYALDQAHRHYLLELLVDARRNGLVAERHFEAILAEIATVQGRARVLQGLRTSLLARQQTDGLLGRFAVQPAQQELAVPLPAYGSSAAERDRFLRRQPGGPGPMFAEFMARADVRSEWPSLLPDFQVYEFSWGFMTEDYGVWNFYVADVWRDGTRSYFDRFAAAWREQAEPQLARTLARAGQDFYISFDDGSSAFCCISLSCVLDDRGQAQARAWLAGEFLERLWPQLVAQATARQDLPELAWLCE